MKIAKFVSLSLAIISGLFALSCQKSEDDGNKKADAVITFTAALNQVTAEGAEVIVRHDGKETDSWYAFFTQDLQADEAALIEAEAAKVTADNLHYGRVQTVGLTGLQEKTTYKFIAFCVTPEKKVYGEGEKPTHASLTFSTSQDLNVTFAVSLGDVTTTSATVTISHDLDPELTYYGFCTEDLTSDINELVAINYASVAAELESGAVGLLLYSGATHTENLTELTSGVRYRYIAYGILMQDGKAVYYGTPGEVEFKTVNFFHEIEDWTISVVDDDTTHEGYPFKVTNTVASGSTAGKYYIVLFTQAQYEAADGFVDDMVAANVNTVVDELRAEAEERGVALADLLLEGTASMYFSLPFDTYYATAIGLEEDGTPNGFFAYTSFTYEPAEEQKQAYNAWLGQWIAGDYVLDFQVGQNYVTYTVSGFAPSMGYDFTATFDAASGAVLIYTQELDHYVDNTYGTISLCLEGCMLRADGNGYAPVSGDYPIVLLTLNADGSALMTPNVLTSQTGSTITLEGMNFYGHILDGQYEGYYLTYNAASTPLLLPNTMTRQAAEGSESYNAWLGKWSITRPEYTEEDEEGNNEPTGEVITDVWEITQDVADRSYLISGLDQFTDPVKAYFNPETGSLTLAEQQITTFTQGGVTYIVYLMGLFNDNEDIWGGTETLFEATLNADGTATLIGQDFSGQTSTGTLSGTFTGMEIFFVNGSTYQLAGYGAEHWNEFYNFPCRLTPLSNTASLAVRSAASRPAGKVQAQAVRTAPCTLAKGSAKARTQYRHTR